MKKDNTETKPNTEPASGRMHPLVRRCPHCGVSPKTDRNPHDKTEGKAVWIRKCHTSRYYPECRCGLTLEGKNNAGYRTENAAIQAWNTIPKHLIA